MHSQISNSKYADSGHSPYWVKELWQNPESRFLVDIDFRNLPPWLVHLHILVRTSPPLLRTSGLTTSQMKKWKLSSLVEPPVVPTSPVQVQRLVITCQSQCFTYTDSW